MSGSIGQPSTKVPFSPEEMAGAYAAAASDKLAEAEAQRGLVEVNREADEDLQAAVHEARAKALREEASICAQLSTSIRLGLVLADRVEMKVVGAVERP